MAERGSNSRPLGTFRSKRYITKPPRPVSYQCDINAIHNIENTTRSSNFIDLVYACLEIFKDKYGEPKTVSIIGLRFLNFLKVNAYEILHFAFEYTTSKITVKVLTNIAGSERECTICKSPDYYFDKVYKKCNSILLLCANCPYSVE